MTLNEIITRFDAHKNGNGYMAKCPIHADSTASLSISEGKDGRILLNCFAKCETKNIVEAIGLKMSDLMPPKVKKTPQIVKIYDYHDGTGKIVFQVVRFDPKDFRQRQPDGNGGFRWTMDGVERILYRLPQVIEAVKNDQVIYKTEGEKDADALVSLGLCATTNPGGAGKWQDSCNPPLIGAHVVVIADKDKTGRQHANLIKVALQNLAKSFCIIELPDRNGHKVKDAYDWVHAGGTLVELENIVKTATTQPPPKPEKTDINLQAKFFQIQMTKGLTPGERYQQMATVVLEKLHACGRFFFHAEHRDFMTAMFFDGTRKLLLPIADDQFLSWLSSLIGINRTERAFQFILAAIQDEALTGKTTGLLPESFWAARPGAIYLSNGDGHLVRITAEGVTQCDNGTDEVLFPSGDTLKPWKLVEPKNPFEHCTLFKSMSTTAPHGKLLFELWVCAMASNQRTKPPLVLSGPVGSGKTRLAVGVAELFGLPPRITAITKNGEEDFWTQAHAGGMVCYDNADTRTDWLPDALAAAATDGTREKRRLYTDTSRIVQRSRAWAIITSANPTFAADSGLADRLLVVRLERRIDETAESALSDEILNSRDSGLSWIADVLSVALADKNAVPGGMNKRHPDFATLFVHMGRAMGREQDALDALKNAEADKSTFNLENDDVGMSIIGLMETDGSFSGTAGELLVKLISIDPSFEGKLSVKRLGKRLSRLWPHLVSMFSAKQEKHHANLISYSLHHQDVASNDMPLFDEKPA